VPLRALPLVAAVLVLLAAGCAGNDEPPAPEPVPSAFKEAVTGALKLADLEVEQDFELIVDVSMWPKRIFLSIDETYVDFEAGPESLDEIVAAVVADAEHRI
jgi:hypothetical protein